MKYAKIENGQIVETEVSEVQMINRNDGGTYVEQRNAVKPQETETHKLTPTYTLNGDYVIRGWEQVERTEFERERFVTAKAAKQAQARIEALKQKLADTDYKDLPNYSPKAGEDLAQVIAERQAWREEIRQLEAEFSEISQPALLVG